MTALQLSKSPKPPRKARLFERVMAAIALVNFGLVLFDYSYIPFRDFYLRQFSAVTLWGDRQINFSRFIDWYGREFKGIEPNRITEAYLATVGDLETQVRQQGEQNLASPQMRRLLAELQSRSEAMVDEDPFQAANKSGTLERIKERMRRHVEDLTGQEIESSKQAFAIFWSPEYLAENGFEQEIGFFNERIQPLIQTNYYRGLGFDGRPTDEFIKIDIWFIGLFGIEFLTRTWYLNRRYKGTNWIDTMLWRWYDVLLLIPFWRWLRIIPLITRINQSNLINLDPLRDRIIRGIIANYAVELTEIVVIRVIEQLQNLIRQGDVARTLLRPEAGPRYIDLNEIDEVNVISKRLSSTLVYQVLPKVRPDIEALLHHNVGKALQELPLYEQVKHLPGLNSLPDQLTRQAIAQLYQLVYGAIADSLQEDKVGADLTQTLIENTVKAFRAEIQQGHTLEEIESLISVWLDEVKINYVKRIAEEDVEKLREQTQQLYQITQTGGKS
jgi:hypothetical protein